MTPWQELIEREADLNGETIECVVSISAAISLKRIADALDEAGSEALEAANSALARQLKITLELVAERDRLRAHIDSLDKK